MRQWEQTHLTHESAMLASAVLLSITLITTAVTVWTMIDTDFMPCSYIQRPNKCICTYTIKLKNMNIQYTLTLTCTHADLYVTLRSCPCPQLPLANVLCLEVVKSGHRCWHLPWVTLKNTHRHTRTHWRKRANLSPRVWQEDSESKDTEKQSCLTQIDSDSHVRSNSITNTEKNLHIALL